MQGCYIGAETLAKVANMDAVKQQLWGLQLSGSACKGDTIEGKGHGRAKQIGGSSRDAAQIVLADHTLCICR